MQRTGLRIDALTIAVDLTGGTGACTGLTGFTAGASDPTTTAVLAVGLCVGTTPRTNGWSGHRAGGGTGTIVAKLTAFAGISASSTMESVCFRVDALVVALQLARWTDTLSTLTELTSLTTVIAGSTMKEILLQIHTSTRADRWRRGWAGKNTLSA